VFPPGQIQDSPDGLHAVLSATVFRMDPSAVVQWFEIVEWFAVDDRLRRAIITKDALRHAGRNGHGTRTDEHPGVNWGDPDSVFRTST
jgi:hypothetical protein